MQDLESEKVKNHLTVLAKRLKKAVSLIQPPVFEGLSKQTLPFSELQNLVEKEHKKLLARKVLIERRKEEQERQMLEMVGAWSCLFSWSISVCCSFVCILFMEGNSIDELPILSLFVGKMKWYAGAGRRV